MKSKLALIGVAFACAVATSRAQDRPPAATSRPVVDDYYGIKITDPYRYLENTGDPDVAKWMKAQSDFARQTLDRISGRPQILADIEKYTNAAPASVSEVHRQVGGRYFFIKTLSGEAIGKLYMRQGADGKDELLVDSDKFAGSNGEPPAINYYQVSRDGRYVAFGISQGGSESATLRIVDTQSKQILPEEIDREEFGSVDWREDNQSFFYNRLQKLTKEMPATEKFQRSKIFLHKLGEPVEKDVAVWGIDVTPNVAFTPMDDGWISTVPGSKWAIGVVEHGVKREFTFYYAPAHAVGTPHVTWKKLCDVHAQVTEYALSGGDDVYLMTHDDAPRFKIIRVDLKSPDLEHAQVIVPQGKTVLHSLQAAKDALYVTEGDGAVRRLLRVPFDGSKPSRIKPPFDGSVYVHDLDTRDARMSYGITSWTRGPQIYEYDPATDESKLTDLQPAGPYDNLPDLESREVTAPSYDGTLVPLSIVCKKDVKLDGGNPTIVMAYGGYGITMDPYFSPSLLAWLNRGGVYAVAHVRGGGELGEAWHLGAYKLTKPNVWRDTIACAKYMIEQKYTSPAKLALTGGSNGGITVGRAVDERPDLFAAANIRAGAVNILRFETDANGIPNTPEFGSISTQEGFEDLYAMDAYHHVRDSVKYPAMLLTTGINDPRVPPWMPTKLAARMQAATASDKPVLLSIDYQGGHGVGASKKQRNELAADTYAFFLWQFGQEGYRLGPTTRAVVRNEH